MKAILTSIQPQHTSNILNLIKLWEIRKKFPKDYVGWVYIYVTKGKGRYCYHAFESDAYTTENTRFIPMTKCNGKVVARFWCDKVEEITVRQDRFKEFMFYETSLDMEDLLKESCLDYNELDNYLYGKNGKAIHITKLEIFDKPKEINEFKHLVKYKDCINCPYNHENMDGDICSKCEELKPLTRAPQSYCFIEI